MCVCASEVECFLRVALALWNCRTPTPWSKLSSPLYRYTNFISVCCEMNSKNNNSNNNNSKANEIVKRRRNSQKSFQISFSTRCLLIQDKYFESVYFRGGTCRNEIRKIRRWIWHLIEKIITLACTQTCICSVRQRALLSFLCVLSALYRWIVFGSASIIYPSHFIHLYLFLLLRR